MAHEPTTSSVDDVLRELREDGENNRLKSLADYATKAPVHGDEIAVAYLAARRRHEGDDDDERVAHYRLIRELGRGGQAVVWLAEDEQLHRQVALKLIQGLGPDGHRLLKRFKREAEITSKLDHPGICAVHDVGMDDVPYIAMRYVDGEPLSETIHTMGSTGGPVPSSGGFTDFESETGATTGDDIASSGPGTAPSSTRELMSLVKMIEDAARALHAAHESGVIHRDIKPGNIMVTKEGEPILLDFGLAKEEDGQDISLTMSGDLMGTPAYMSPEQLTRQTIRLDRRTDIYSLGVTLFECLTGQRPFERPTREALYNAILTEPPEDVRRLNKAVTKDLKVVLETAMAKNRDDRYQTALELAEDLRRIREIEPITAKPAGAIKRVTRWAQRNPALAAALVIIFLAISTAAGVLSVKNEQVRRESQQKDEALSAKDEALKKEQAAIDERKRMSDVKRLANARSEAAALWPVHPDLVPKIEKWKTDHSALFARLPDHEAALARLRKNALPYTEADRQRDHASEYSEIARLEEELKEIEAKLDVRDDAKLEDRLEEVEDRLKALSDIVAGRRWDLGDDVDAQFMHDTFEQLVKELRAFIEPKTGVVASVDERLALSRTIEAKTVLGLAKEWNKTIRGIEANPRHGGLKLTPQVGLIPLGPDPETGYFEFLHWLSHDQNTPLPGRNSDGRFEVTAETGIILVLLPGGTFKMGRAGRRLTRAQGRTLIRRRDVMSRRCTRSRSLPTSWEVRGDAGSVVAAERPR